MQILYNLKVLMLNIQLNIVVGISVTKTWLILFKLMYFWSWAIKTTASSIII